jgi:hypothetical protein
LRLKVLGRPAGLLCVRDLCVHDLCVRDLCVTLAFISGISDGRRLNLSHLGLTAVFMTTDKIARLVFSIPISMLVECWLSAG